MQEAAASLFRKVCAGTPCWAKQGRGGGTDVERERCFAVGAPRLDRCHLTHTYVRVKLKRKHGESCSGDWTIRCEFLQH
uniref:Uncharacterized protein n=1 Tax=Hyaloperonospora arabidopsidis (strain Emoy2) TaxID=559515 RepID=M4B5Q5_HYAAE